jgi:hypothetical protein
MMYPKKCLNFIGENPEETQGPLYFLGILLFNQKNQSYAT